MAMDKLEEADIGVGLTPRPMYLNANMPQAQKVEVRCLLQEVVDCFMWEYTEMPGLERGLVEHKLPIKLGFRPYRQPPRNYDYMLYACIKEEVDKLLKARFIQPCRYMEWLSNIVLVEKKGSGKIRICVYLRNLNRATPKDMYPMPIADILINKASGNRIISFLDGNTGYNQIFMAIEDISKTAFRCP
jgi:hypothetical protein